MSMQTGFIERSVATYIGKVSSCKPIFPRTVEEIRDEIATDECIDPLKRDKWRDAIQR